MFEWAKRLVGNLTPRFLKRTRAILTIETIYVTEDSYIGDKLLGQKQTYIDKHTFELKEDIVMIKQISSARLLKILEKQGGSVIMEGSTLYVSGFNYRHGTQILLQWDEAHQTYRYMFEKRLLRDRDTFQLVGLVGTERGKISSGGKTTFYYQRL